MTTEPISYDQLLYELNELRYKRNEKTLQKNYPVKYVIWHSLLLGTLSIKAISLQKVTENISINDYFGIFVGFFLLFPTFFALLVS
jgi:hypothetical protein